MIDLDSEDGREHGVTVLGPLTDDDDPWEKPERFAIVRNTTHSDSGRLWGVF